MRQGSYKVAVETQAVGPGDLGPVVNRQGGEELADSHSPLRGSRVGLRLRTASTRLCRGAEGERSNLAIVAKHSLSLCPPAQSHAAHRKRLEIRGQDGRHHEAVRTIDAG